jgi:hypothetical protein
VRLDDYPSTKLETIGGRVIVIGGVILTQSSRWLRATSGRLLRSSPKRAAFSLLQIPLQPIDLGQQVYGDGGGGWEEDG